MTQRINHDVVIRLVTVSVPRDEVPRTLKRRRITADRLVGYRYADHQGNLIELVYTTGPLPVAHECQARVPVAEKTALGIWERHDRSLQFFLVYNQGDVPADQFRLDMLATNELVRANGLSADYLDTVFPLKSLNQVSQYALIGDDLVRLNPGDKPGLVMVRLDRVNQYAMALATDAQGAAKRLVGLEADLIKHDPGLLTKPEAWTTLVETDRNMTFFSRPDNSGLVTRIAVNFEDSTVRMLLADHGHDHPFFQWEGEAQAIGYYVIGHLAGQRNTMVGYAGMDSAEGIALHFAPREDMRFDATDKVTGAS